MYRVKFSRQIHQEIEFIDNVINSKEVPFIPPEIEITQRKIVTSAEQNSAMSTHNDILSYISSCPSVNSEAIFMAAGNWPFASSFMTRDEADSHSSSSYRPSTTSGESSTGNSDVDLDILKSSYILSTRIMSERMFQAEKSSNSHYLLSLFTIFSITLGMVTTIVVSLSGSSIAREGSLPSIILRIAAVSLPAVSTALSATIAFVGPEAAWSQSARTLASLAQLHNQMSVSIVESGCSISQADQAILAANVKEWGKQFINIMSLASTSPDTSPRSPSETGNRKDPQDKKEPQDKPVTPPG